MGLEDCPGRYVLEPHGVSIQGPMQRNRPHVTDPTAPGWPRRWAVRYIPFSLHVVVAAWSAWRIRLVAYGARLESVLGASPRGFESPILRHQTPEPAQVPGFSLRLQRKVPIVGEGCCSNESRVFPLVVELEGKNRGTKYEISTTRRGGRWGKLSCCCCLWPRLISGRREACPPASRPRRELRSARRLEARPGPAAAHRHCGRSLRRPPHQWGWGAVVWFGVSSRSQPWPCRRPPALRPGLAAASNRERLVAVRR